LVKQVSQNKENQKLEMLKITTQNLISTKQLETANKNLNDQVERLQAEKTILGKKKLKIKIQKLYNWKNLEYKKLTSWYI